VTQIDGQRFPQSTGLTHRRAAQERALAIKYEIRTRQAGRGTIPALTRHSYVDNLHL
jgi:hypothetical protein